ncbi:uncharacterized protein LOC142591005 isoform X1 [Dermacentor variabilis]|uniref:uncharacterized protein LOC142591005 isoform X1 n=1 Tax=Dermacentor variabilis TaxID=34621 RepID=UPI003F5C6E00
MPGSRTDLLESGAQRVVPAVHGDFFVVWVLCMAAIGIVGVPVGLIAVHRMRAETGAHLGDTGKGWPGALPFRDRYVAPEQVPVRMPRQCLLADESGNLTFDLSKQYVCPGPTVGGGGGGLSPGSKAPLQVFCYYNKSRVSWLQGGKTWFGVASVPFHLCRYVIYGPVKLDGWTAKLLPTARDVILVEQLSSTVAFSSANTTSLLVSVRGRGEFTTMRRSAGNVRYFAANLLEWALEHGFSGVHLDWRGLESPLCGRPGNDAALEAILRQLRDLAQLNQVPLILALSASAVPAAPGDLVDYYFLEAADRRCADLEEAGLDTLYRRLRESEASAFSVCWAVSAAVEVFERTVGVAGTHLRFAGLVQRSRVCNVPANDSFQECSVGELPQNAKRGLVFRYRAADKVATNVRHYAKVWKGLDLRTDPMCVLYVDGDFDDPAGECGDPFPLLRAILAS